MKKLTEALEKSKDLRAEQAQFIVDLNAKQARLIQVICIQDDGSRNSGDEESSVSLSSIVAKFSNIMKSIMEDTNSISKKW